MGCREETWLALVTRQKKRTGLDPIITIMASSGLACDSMMEKEQRDRSVDPAFFIMLTAGLTYAVVCQRTEGHASRSVPTVYGIHLKLESYLLMQKG